MGRGCYGRPGHLHLHAISMDKKQFDELVKKVEKAKAMDAVDLSNEEDLSLAIMNLISLEEHFFFTGNKTKKPDYFDLLSEVREMRKKLLARMMDKNEGETWCISKHLLATTMRLMEVGTKLHGDGKKKEGEEFFSYAYKIYSMFWAIRLKLIDSDEFKKIASKENDDKKPWTLGDIVDKLVDCCDE